MKKKSNKKQTGSLLVWAMLITIVVGVIVGVIQKNFSGSSKAVIEDGIAWKAQELASNLVEMSKYFILYDRVMYVDKAGPLNHLESSDRSNNMINVLNRGIGLDKFDPLSLGALCGAFDLKGSSMGTYKIGSSKVFCPYFLRIPQLTSKEMEVILFENWEEKDVVTRESTGVYKIEVDFTESIKNFEKSFIKWADDSEREEYGRLFNKITKAYVILKFFTESSGFASQGNDRTLSIEGRIEFGSALSGKMIVVEAESFVMRPSVPKDYAAFFLYPTKPTASGDIATRKFSEAINIGSASTISGRAYFNGELDKPLNSLPTFNEYAIFSRAINPRPTISDEGLLKSKFPKGFLTHFSAERWLFSGNCDELLPTVNIVNQTGYKCKSAAGNNFTMVDFFSLVPNACTGAPATINSGEITNINCSASSNTTCPSNCPKSPFISIIGYPLADLTVSGSHAFVVAPVAKVEVKDNGTNLYGSLFGGYLNSAGNTLNLIAAPSWKTGLPGITNEETLNSYSQSYLSSTAGITAPLMNMPLVYGVSSGVK
jgi:hypothetical protein